jgi:hypothetical protein
MPLEAPSLLGPSTMVPTKKSNKNKNLHCPAWFSAFSSGSTPPQPGAQLMNRGGSVASVLPVGPVMTEVEPSCDELEGVKARYVLSHPSPATRGTCVSAFRNSTVPGPAV